MLRRVSSKVFGRLAATVNTEANARSRKGRVDSAAMSRSQLATQGHVMLCVLLAMATTAFASLAMRLNRSNLELRDQVQSLEEIAGVTNGWPYERSRRP